MTDRQLTNCPCIAPLMTCILQEPRQISLDMISDIKIWTNTQVKLRDTLKSALVEYLHTVPTVHTDAGILHECLLKSALSLVAVQNGEFSDIDCLQEIFDEYPEVRGACLNLMMRLVSSDRICLPSRYVVSCLSEAPLITTHPIARGGFANVYRAHLDTENGKFVAVKMPRKKYAGADDRKFLVSINKEFLLWKQIHHNHILRLIGACSWLGILPSIVSPWMRKGSINKFMQSSKNKIGLRDKLKWLSQILEALVHLHEEFVPGPVLHLDLRCDNILLNDDNQAVVADFGLTKIDDSIFKTIDSTVQSGNPRWTAPELTLSSTGCKDPKAAPNMKWGIPTSKCDIWSFGMTCLEIVTEELPFSHLSLDGGVVLEVYKGMRPARPASLLDGLDALWNVIEQCWATDPEARPTASVLLKTVKGLSSKSDCTVGL